MVQQPHVLVGRHTETGEGTLVEAVADDALQLFVVERVAARVRYVDSHCEGFRFHAACSRAHDQLGAVVSPLFDRFGRGFPEL